jgi:hypothetical protein
MRQFLFSAWAAGLVGVSLAGAQTVPRKEPAQYVVPERASRVEAPPPGMRLGLRKPREFALAPLRGSEVALLSEPGPRLRTGVHRSLPPGILSTGTWEVTSEGVRIWRMVLRSPGSTGLRVEFRNFSAGNGLVWLHDGAHVAGPYTGRGLFDDGHFWSASLSADSITIEYQPDPATPQETAPPFEIRTIAHQANGRRASTSLRSGIAPLPVPDAGSVDPAAYCHLDPNCYPDWKSAMPMVAQISFEDSGVEYLCSGSLIATRDNSFKPYFLTAGHCIHSEDAARSLEAYWTYQTSTCGGTPPASRDTSTKSTLGAHLIDFGTIEQGDYSLVLLKDIPNNVTFSGWDVTDPPVLTPLAGIHHPMGSWKRISFGERVTDQTVVVEDSTAPGDKYLQVLEEKGRTEPGSSGSPVFSSPGVIVGTLTYGLFSPDISVCEIDPSVDGYGRFSVAYQNLQDYLENLPAAVVTPDKTGVTFTVSNHATPPGQTVRLTTQSTGTIAYKLRADASWLQISTVSGTLSASTPAQVAITVNASNFDQPGQYTNTVTILSGTAAPQFINVTATVTVDQSNVTASITPSPVVLTAGQWSLKIRLAETAGAATRVSAMKINGTDYSANIKSWFGTDRIPAKGVIEAPLSGSGTFPAGTQYFEFWGIDDSGQHWYRVTTATFQ